MSLQSVGRVDQDVTEKYVAELMNHSDATLDSKLNGIRKDVSQNSLTLQTTTGVCQDVIRVMLNYD